MNRNLFSWLFSLLLAIFGVIAFATFMLRSGNQTASEQPANTNYPESMVEGGMGWIFCGIPITFVAGIMVAGVIQERQVMSRLDQDRFKESPGLHDVVPEGAELIMQALRERGFKRIGEMAYYESGRRLPAAAPVLAGLDNKVLAIVVVNKSVARVLLTLETFYPDGAALYTYHPAGASANRPYLKTSVQTASPDEAVAQHIRQIQDLETKHGHVYLVASLKDRAAWWTTFGALHKNDQMPNLAFVKWLLPVLIIMVLMAIDLNTAIVEPMLRTQLFFGGQLLVMGWVVLNIVRGRIRFTVRR